MQSVTETIVAFLRGIGVRTEAAVIDGETFLPGLTIDSGALIYDPSRLTYPGDLLHEAGHIAFTPADQRPLLSRQSTWELGEEIAAIAWSYAAAVHLGLDPAIVFHGGGYRGSSSAFIENFAAGRYAGVPLLEWAGMAEEKTPRNSPPIAYPRMLKWLRD